MKKPSKEAVIWIVAGCLLTTAGYIFGLDIVNAIAAQW